MKKLLIGFICAGGLLMAQDVTYTYQPAEPAQQQGHLSEDARIALRTHRAELNSRQCNRSFRKSKCSNFYETRRYAGALRLSSTFLLRRIHDPRNPANSIFMIDAPKNRLRQIEPLNLAAPVGQHLICGQKFPISRVRLPPLL